jgi:hypothetical protein
MKKAFNIEINKVIEKPKYMTDTDHFRSQPFNAPLKHIWSVQMPNTDLQHIVVFKHESHASVIMNALGSYQLSMLSLPTRVEDFSVLFAKHVNLDPDAFECPTDVEMSVAEHDFSELKEWALSRNICVLVITDIHQKNTKAPFKVHMTHIEPRDTIDDGLSYKAFFEDFAWQMIDVYD